MTEEATIAEAPAVEETIEQVAAKIFGADAPAVADDAEAKPAAPVPEPVKDPAAERVSARILANQRAEIRAAKVRADLAAAHVEVEAKRAEVGELAKLADLVKAAKSSPSKVLEMLGYDAKGFLETLATEHEPEAVAIRAVAGTKTELEKLQARIDAMEAAETARVRAQATQETHQQSVHAQEEFLEHVAASADKYPNTLEEFTPREIVAKGWELASKHAEGFRTRFGRYPHDEEIAEELELQATARAEERRESAWRERIGKGAPPARQATPSVDVRATQMDRGPSPRTLTSRAASERAATPPKWTQEAADEESIRILQAALKAG